MNARNTALGFLLGLVAICTNTPTEAFAQTNPIDTQEYLRQFHANPKKVMNTPLARIDANGNILPSPPIPDEAARDEIRKERDAIRERICAMSGHDCMPVKKSSLPSAWSSISELNEFKRFILDPEFSVSLADTEAKGLLHSQSPKAPWSDSFWPIMKGITARRWLDPSFPDSKDFMANYNYFLGAPPMSIGLNIMSPAEKYDYLVGDGSFRFTNSSWYQGKAMYDRLGSVPTWQGICHGWAPAGIMTPAPKRSVILYNVNGHPVTFYPSDIKALTSAAWAESPPKTYVAGTRCQVSRPKEDPNGRVIDEGCFDVNPATWHVGIVHEMGANKRSFVVETQYDYQIWNYPLYSYSYSYFNPQTLETSSTLGGAVIRTSDFKIDKFKKYRNPSARYIVGIVMEISYSIETAPSTRPYQIPKLETRKFMYDLEVDGAGRIIGGEWYSNFHPDFIWHFDKDAKPLSDVELAMPAPPSWDGVSPFPQELRQSAISASGKLQPLNAVVEALVRLGQQTE